MPKYVTKLENSWTGERQLVTRQEATTAEAVVGVLGLFVNAYQGHKWSKANKLVERASAEAENGNYDEAISLVSTMIEMYPDIYDGYVMRAMCYGLAQRHDEAIKDFSQAIEMDKKNADFYDKRAFSYYEKGEIANGLRDASMAIKLQPDEDSYYPGRAKLLVELGNMEQAIADYNRAIQLNPAESNYYKGRGYTYAKMHHYQKAIPDYSRGITLDPNEPLAFQFRGEAYAKMRDYQKAIADYSRAITLDPNDPQPFQLRGEAYQALGDHAKSSSDFNQAKNIAISMIKRLLNKLTIQTTTFSQFTDKNRAKRVRSLMDKILFSSNKRLTAAQLKDAKLAIQYIEQMPMLNELITAQKLKDELEATNKKYDELKTKLKHLNRIHSVVFSLVLLSTGYVLYYKFNSYLFGNINTAFNYIVFMFFVIMVSFIMYLVVAILLSPILPMRVPEYPKMKSKKESLTQKMPTSTRYEDLYRQFGGQFNSSKYIAMRGQGLNYINRLLDSIK